MIDGIIHDTYDPQRKTYWYGKEGQLERTSERCVYGYWLFEGKPVRAA